MTGKASPVRAIKAGARISAITFDPDVAAETCSRLSIVWNAWAELQGLGIRFRSTMRHTDVSELWPGAASAAENDSEFGWFLRRTRIDGFCSQNPQVVQALEARGNKERNSQIQRHLRKTRNTKGAQALGAAIDDAISKRREAHELAENGEAAINQAILAKQDWRDVAANWPRQWRGGVFSPLANNHERGRVGATSNTVMSESRAMKVEK